MTVVEGLAGGPDRDTEADPSTAGQRPADPSTAGQRPDSVNVLADMRSHLRKSKAGISGIVITVTFTVVAIVGPYLPFLPDAQKQSLRDNLTPPVGWGGTWSHPLGTDALGRDILARLVDGARISLIVSLAAVALAAVFGTALGLLAGYMGGRIDTLIVSAADVQMAFPGVLAGLILVAAFGPSVWLVILVIAMSSWMVFTRVGRSLVLTQKELLFVKASELAGASSWRIMGRHLLPNFVSTLITLCVLELAAAILSESAFAFLGFGVQPPKVSWGLMIHQGRDYVTNGWWIVTFAGMAIAVVVLGVNLLSHWLKSFNDVAEREQIILETPGA